MQLHLSRLAVIARSPICETQEYLLALITHACAVYSEILALEMRLKKSPVLAGTGSLGVRLVLGAEDLIRMRHLKD